MEKGINIQLAQGDYGWKGDDHTVCVCDQCKEKYKHFTTEIVYQQKLNKKIYTFCSYNCKRKFQKEHEAELAEQRYQEEYKKSEKYMKELAKERSKRDRQKRKARKEKIG